MANRSDQRLKAIAYTSDRIKRKLASSDPRHKATAPALEARLNELAASAAHHAKLATPKAKH